MSRADKDDRLPEEPLSLGDYARYAGLVVFGVLVLLIGIGDRDHAFAIVAAVLALLAAGGAVLYVVRSRS